MIISFRQSRGVFGPIKAVDVNTEVLDEPHRQEVEQLVAVSGIKNSNGRSYAQPGDWLQYEVVFEWGDHSAAFSCDNKAIPTSIRPLLRYLEKRAQPFPPDDRQ